MLTTISPLTSLRAGLAEARIAPVDIAFESIERANKNASQNTYLHFDSQSLLQSADAFVKSFPRDREKPPLFGIPVSLKDCFDLAGALTTCGSRFYAGRSPAEENSAMAAQLLIAGALITGKTHLHPLAYGITGQNAEYGDCLQPRDSSLLTGGSSSGAAASVQEGSALVAIGTDTGGSIRVPAALCGLVGFRASHGLASSTGYCPGIWAGAAHLAPSFDTLGFLCRDPRDAAFIAHALFNIPIVAAPSMARIGMVADSFLMDCESDVLLGFQTWQQHLFNLETILSTFDPFAWRDTLDIFAGIQAHEAAKIHQGSFDHFDGTIRDRLHWGESLNSEYLGALHVRLKDFRFSMHTLFERFDLLMLPVAPVSRLKANSDLSDARRIILRYTTPFSLAGLPTISLPSEMIGGPFGTGVQIAAAPGADASLLAFARLIGERLAK